MPLKHLWQQNPASSFSNLTQLAASVGAFLAHMPSERYIPQTQTPSVPGLALIDPPSPSSTQVLFPVFLA